MRGQPARAPARAVRWLMLRTGEGPLRPVWKLLYNALIRTAALVLRTGLPVETVYVRGSFAVGEPVYGFSDVDLVVVVERDPAQPGENGRRVRSRVRRAYQLVPSLRYVIEVTVFEEPELEDAVLAPFLANVATELDGLPRARHFGSDPTVRPDAGARLYGPLRPRWRVVTGPDVLSAVPPSADAYRWLWAWADMQFNWKHVFRTCVNPDLPQTAHFYPKFVALPIRLLLWLERGELVLGEHLAVLERGLQLMPEEEEVIRTALALRRDERHSPEVPLDKLLRWLLAMTGRIADDLAHAADVAGSTEVRLVPPEGDEPLVAPAEREELGDFLDRDQPILPLSDWRTVVLGGVPDESFAVISGDPGCVADLGRVARVAGNGPYPAFRRNGLLLLPNATSGLGGAGRCSFRSVQSRVTDPVSLAVADGCSRCQFANLPGWSVQDMASRAVAEHRAWLHTQPIADAAPEVGMLLSAVRVGLFAESVARGEPELPLTVGAAAKRLGGIPEEAWEGYREGRIYGKEPSTRWAAAFDAYVRRLPVYAG